MALWADIATSQKIIYKDGYAVNSHILDAYLKHGSYVATEVCEPCISKCQ